MKFKIDTKEKFTVITPDTEFLSDIITEELLLTATNCLQSDTKNIVLNLRAVTAIDDLAAEHLVKTQQYFYESNASFVICNIQTSLEKKLDELELLDMMNITPTESEAWDIVQMEEIERELLDGDDIDFDLTE
jgi:anti-anti-sigma regulatory factor